MAGEIRRVVGGFYGAEGESGGDHRGVMGGEEESGTDICGVEKESGGKLCGLWGGKGVNRVSTRQEEHLGVEGGVGGKSQGLWVVASIGQNRGPAGGIGGPNEVKMTPGVSEQRTGGYRGL